MEAYSDGPEYMVGPANEIQNIGFLARDDGWTISVFEKEVKQVLEQYHQLIVFSMLGAVRGRCDELICEVIRKLKEGEHSRTVSVVLPNEEDAGTIRGVILKGHWKSSHQQR